MKRLLVALAALAFAVPALAQERRPIGVGVAINPLEGADVPPRMPTVEFYVPLQIGPMLRIEPSFGLRTADRPSGQQDERDFVVGVGVFGVTRLAQPVDVYAGGRLKLDFAHVTFATGGSDSGTDVLISAALGAEDYLSPHFSIGLEAQLGYYSLSSVTRASGGEASGFFTTGLAFLRVYF